MRRRGPGPVEWLFRNRRTGGITIVQLPNRALGLFLVAALVQWLCDPPGRPGGALGLVAIGALIWGGVDEVVRGVNPWRRVLGGAVLAGQVFRLAV